MWPHEFQQFIREEIASGLSIELFSRALSLCDRDPDASSSDAPHVPRMISPTAGTMMMQTSGRVRRSVGTTIEMATTPTCPEDLQVFGSSSVLPSLSIGDLQGELPPPPQLPAWSTIRDIWRFYFGGVRETSDAHLHVVTWFVDHDWPRWSDDSRAVQLGPDFTTWRDRLIEAWPDAIRFRRALEFEVVVPFPVGSSQEVHAHIILVQRPRPMKRAVLLTIVAEDPVAREPPTFALSVSCTLDHWEIVYLAQLDLQCAPRRSTPSCRSYWGNTDLSSGHVFDVHSGMALSIWVHDNPLDAAVAVAEEIDLQSDEAAFIQLNIDKTIGIFEQLSCIDPTNDEQLLEALPDSAAVTFATLSELSDKFCRELQLFQAALPDVVPASCLRPTNDPEEPPRQRHPVILALEHVLPWPTPPGHDQDLFMHSATANWQHRLQQAEISLAMMPDGLNLHPATYDAMVVPSRYTDITLANRAALFIDGSAQQGEAAWSVACIRYDDFGIPALFGMASGPVVTADSHPRWLGARFADNLAAEMTAFVYASVLALSLDFGAPVVIAPDLDLSVMLAEDKCTCKAHPLLVAMLHCLGHCLRTQGTLVTPVRAHRGHPWNELADGLAKFALGHGIEVGRIVAPVLHEMMSQNDVMWAWLSQQSASFAACMPPSPEPGLWHITPPATKPSFPSSSTTSLDPARVCFVAVTANVLALDSTDTTQQVLHSSRAARLDHQWHSQQVAVAGLQETRRSAGKGHLDHYVTFSSGAEITGFCPHHGCELWLHKTIPWTVVEGYGPVAFGAMHATVAHADPRRLVVHLELHHVQISFVVLHAPCRSAGVEGSIDAIHLWWADTIQMLRTVRLATHVWVFADLNADIGAADLQHFSTFGHLGDSPQAALAEDALQQLDWFAPTTFAWCHQGQHSTWKHPRGTDHRLDFVLCSREAFSMAHSSWVDVAHDSGFAHDDHLPVHLNVSGWLDLGPGRPKLQWDLAALADPSRCARFQEALATLPLPTWATDVDTHVQLWESNVLQLAQQFFARGPRVKQRPRLREATVNLIALKRSILDYARSNHLLPDPGIQSHLKEIEKDIRQRVCLDQREFFEELVQQLGAQGDLRNYKFVFNLLTRLGGRPGHRFSGGKALPLLRPAGQAPLRTFQEQQMHWLRQFAEVEAGHVMSKDSLQALHHPGLGLNPAILDKQVIPTLYELQTQIKKMKRGKAPGPNHLPTDVLKAGGAIVARQLATVTTKVSLRGAEPLSWRGGRLIPLHKGKLCRADPAGYRSIFVSSHTTKAYHASLRRQLLDAWSSVLMHLQFGGVKGMAADLAHHCLQAHLAHAAHFKLPVGILFVDMKAAFYSVVRQGLFPEGPDAAPFLHAMYQLGISPQHVADLMTTAHSDAAVTGISEHAVALLRDLMERTFFQVDGVDPVVLTTQGTRPGDPVGDAFFNLAMAVILRKVTNRIQANTSAEWQGQAATVASFDQICTPAHFAWFEVAFVDDCALALRAPCNDQLRGLAGLALDAILGEAGQRGLSLNFEAGKTELLVHWRGSGSRAFKESIAAAGGVIHVDCGEKTMPLRCTFGYKHLGSWVQNTAVNVRDARARLTEARRAWGPLVRPVFRRRCIKLATKCQIFEALVSSRLVYNVHVWTAISDVAWMQWTNGVRSMLYPLVTSKLRGLPPFQFSVETLSGLASMLAPSDALHVARLRYFRRWIVAAPPILWNLLATVGERQGGWLLALKQSFSWFLRFYGARCSLTDSSDLLDWIAFVSLDTCWKGRIKRAISSCRSYRAQYAFVEVWQAFFLSQMQQDGVRFPEDECSLPPMWQCDLCQEGFPSKRALAMHASKRHGYRTLVKHYAIDGQCPNCCRDFHGRARLCAHLRGAQGCLRRLQACFPPLTLEQMKDLDATDNKEAKELKKQGWLPTKALAPVIRAYGPELPPVPSLDADEMLVKWRRRDAGGDLTAVDALSGLCLHTDLPVAPKQADLPEVVFVFQSPFGTQTGTTGCFATSGLARLHAMLHIRTLCFVHVYSGFRRPGDLQWQIEHHWVQGSLQVFCLSIDYCLQKDKGDLAGAHSVQWWADRVLTGAVFGIGGGPPCETWSAARLLPDGPRPLRTYDEPFGLPALSPKEWRQVETGTQLVLFIVHMIYLCARIGGCGFLEHPAFPTWAKHRRPCSIWATQPLRWLKRLRAIQICTFDQCCVGCEGRKPTTMALLRLNSFADKMRQRGFAGRCAHPPGTHVSLQGRDCSGQFRTAIAKVYPPQLNAMLADSICSHAQLLSEVLPPVEPLASCLAELNRTNFVTDHVQPDYYDR